MSYGLTVWGNMIPNTSLIKLQKIQNKCFKLIFGKESTKDNFHSSKLLRVSDMIKLVNLKHGHKVQYSHLPEQVLNCSKTDNKEKNLIKQHRYPTRNKGIPNLPKTDCAHYHQSFLLSKYFDLSTASFVCKIYLQMKNYLSAGVKILSMMEQFRLTN